LILRDHIVRAKAGERAVIAGLSADIKLFARTPQVIRSNSPPTV
jgi:hypothetical protein